MTDSDNIEAAKGAGEALGAIAGAAAGAELGPAGAHAGAGAGAAAGRFVGEAAGEGVAAAGAIYEAHEAEQQAADTQARLDEMRAAHDADSGGGDDSSSE